MNAKNHLFFSISFVLLFLKILNKFNFNINIWFIFLSSIITCLLPDIDHHNSFLRSRFRYFVYLLLNFFKHRSFTHSLFGIFIFLYFLLNINYLYFNFNNNILIGMILGYISHIVGDIFTYNGIKFFWPLNIRLRIPIINFFFKNNEYYFCLFIFYFSFFIYNFIIFKKIFYLCLNYINLII